MKYDWIPILLFFALSASGTEVKIDLQWSICESDPQTVLKKLGEDGKRKPYKTAPVTYYDTNPPLYIWDGLMFRTKTRRDEQISAIKASLGPSRSDAGGGGGGGGGGDDAMVETERDSVGPNEPTKFLCNWDRYGVDTYFTCQVQALLAGTTQVWTEEQVRFAEAFGHIKWGNLVGFGPNPNPKWRLKVADYPAVFDDVQSGHMHFMELEVKVPKSEGQTAYDKISEHLLEHGILFCPEQKARTARLFKAMGFNEVPSKLVHQSDY